MKYFVYRYSPITVQVPYSENLAIVCPPALRSAYVDRGFPVEQIFVLDDFELWTLLDFFESRSDIEDLFTLDEDLMDIVALVHLFLSKEKGRWRLGFLYKDKKRMRQQVEGHVNQPRLLNPQESLPSNFMVKVRNGSAAKGVSRLTSLPEGFDTSQQLLEEVFEHDYMFTCDGLAIDGTIRYFFSHEYLGTVLDSREKYCTVIRTNSRYADLDFIQRLQRETQKVLEALGTERVHPFHAEFFYNSKTDELAFCEVGKRFGGGNIPLLIETAFDVDILKRYWELQLETEHMELTQRADMEIGIEKVESSSGGRPPIEDTTLKLAIPTNVATSILFLQNGREQTKPEPPYSLTYFREYPDRHRAAKSVGELRFLMSLLLKNEDEWQELLQWLRGYLDES